MNEDSPADAKETKISSFFRKLTGKDKKEDDVTEEEIIDMVNEGHEQGVLKENEAEMIHNIFEFGDKQAQDIMIHRKNVVALDGSMTIEEAFQITMAESYSRYPVYEDNIDNIIGIFHIRDLVKAYVQEENRHKTLKEMKSEILFDAYFIPETRNISLLFKKMQSNKIHMAVVVDEYGQTAGVVTLEDILEEIVGNILDEYDNEEEMICRQEDGSYLIDGQTPLEDVEDALHISFHVEDIDTLNGYMTYRLGKIPEENEHFETECEGYGFRILSVDNKIIQKVRVWKLPEETGNNQEDEA